MRAWYPFYPKDFLIDTLELSLEEECLYRRLIDLYYINEGPLLFDEVFIAKKSRIGRRKLRQILPNVLNFFVISDGKLHHKRIDAELEKSRKIREVRSELGRRGGLAKAKAIAKNKPLAKAVARHNHNHNHSNNKYSTQPTTSLAGACAHGHSHCSPEQVVEIYHDMLPDLIPIKRLTPKLISQIEHVSRIPQIGCSNETHWRNFFKRVARSDWLTGRAKNEPSRYSLRGLLDEETYTKIAEGQYDNR